MGGRVGAESTPRQGSVFSFTIELGIPDPSPDQTLATEDFDLSAIRALVVDDSATCRAITREMLEAKGAVVSEAESGATALATAHAATLAREPFNLLLIDSALPGMEGSELIAQLRAERQTRLPVIMMVNSTGLTGNLSSLTEPGLATYIVKPLKQRELIAKVRELIATARECSRVAMPPPIEAPLRRDADCVTRPLHLLLADDSPDNRMLIRAYLKKTPYSLDEAENGKVALDRFIRGKYDVVLMDIQMPILDGYSAVRMIREWEHGHRHKRTPIIALTASALDDAVRRAHDAGCDMHVSKPVKKATLLEAIANSIESAEAVVS